MENILKLVYLLFIALLKFCSYLLKAAVRQIVLGWINLEDWINFNKKTLGMFGRVLWRAVSVSLLSLIHLIRGLVVIFGVS